jgi:hypothetical protein
MLWRGARGEGLAPSTCLFYNGYVSWKNGGVVMITYDRRIIMAVRIQQRA